MAALFTQQSPLHPRQYSGSLTDTGDIVAFAQSQLPNLVEDVSAGTCLFRIFVSVCLSVYMSVCLCVMYCCMVVLVTNFGNRGA